MKFRIEISMLMNFAGLFLGHVLKCRATVVLLLYQNDVTETNEKLFWSGLHTVFHQIYKLLSR